MINRVSIYLWSKHDLSQGSSLLMNIDMCNSVDVDTSAMRSKDTVL